MKTAAVGYFDENGNWVSDADKPVVTSTAPAPAATTARVEPAPTVSNSQTAGTAGTRPARKHLPRTSSSLALFELISGLSIAGGIAIRQLRARVQ
jgi:hypothetical protein